MLISEDIMTIIWSTPEFRRIFSWNTSAKIGHGVTKPRFINTGMCLRYALLLKQMPKKQTGFLLLLKQNKPGLVFHHQN